MGSQGLDILVYPGLTSKSEELVLLLSQENTDQESRDQIKTLAKNWLELYNKAKTFVFEPPFTYCNMYMMVMRESCKRGKIEVGVLIDAYNLWINAFDSFQRGYKAEDN